MTESKPDWTSPVRTVEWFSVPVTSGPWRPAYLAVLFDRLMALQLNITEMRVQARRPYRVDVQIIDRGGVRKDAVTAKIEDAVSGIEATAVELDELVRARRPGIQP